jgi:hypothetical protein
MVSWANIPKLLSPKRENFGFLQEFALLPPLELYRILPPPPLLALPPHPTPYFVIIPVNGDGFADFVHGNDVGDVSWWQSSGGPEPSFVGHRIVNGTDAVFGLALRAVDMDGDGT